MKDMRKLTGYSRLQPRLGQTLPEATAARALEKHGSAEQLDAITTVLAGSRLTTMIGLGDHSGYLCLSLLDASIAERATVYHVNSGALAAGRTMARHMGLSDRISFVERAPSLDLVRALPSVDLMICLNVLPHAGTQFDQAAVGHDGWEWLTEMRRKCKLAVVGIAFEETKPKNWDVPRTHRAARFAQCAEQAGWALLYDANVRDIERLGVERANGRYSEGGHLLGQPQGKRNVVKRTFARLGGAAGIQTLTTALDNERQSQHLYILEAEKISLPHLVIVAGTSGAGKSTFVDQLRGRQLRQEIYRRLPSGVSDWPVVGSSKRPLFPRRAPGIVFQFDMNGRGISKGRDFGDDPALFDVAHARAVTVVNLRPPPGLMIDQLIARDGGGRTKKEILKGTSAWPLPQKSWLLNRILRSWNPRIDRDRLHSCRRKISLYDQEDWLDGLYARWEAYLLSLSAKGIGVEQIFLEPDLSTQSGNAYSWRIASAHQKTDADPARVHLAVPTLEE